MKRYSAIAVFDKDYHFLDTMPNLPWLCAMARQRLLSDYDGADVHVVEEVGREEVSK